MQVFAQGAFRGILPTMLFFFVALVCFKRQLPLSIVLGSGFGAWLVAACVHQWLLK